MTVRAKFRLTQVHHTQPHNTQCAQLVFEPMYDAKLIEEDVTFATATPSGKLEMYVDSPTALAQFEHGKYYYIDFTEVPDAD